MDGLYIMENPIKMDDLGVPLFFLETPIYTPEIQHRYSKFAMEIKGVSTGYPNSIIFWGYPAVGFRESKCWEASRLSVA